MKSTPDTLNSIGVLARREIEARILVPLLDAFSQEFGRERVIDIFREVISHIAREQGAALAESRGGNTLAKLADSFEDWKKGDALQMEVLEKSEERFSFNVPCCQYAKMYNELGVSELGSILSCSRDHALVEGFNTAIHLTRTQTIMEGAAFCDFRYKLDRIY